MIREREREGEIYGSLMQWEGTDLWGIGRSFAHGNRSRAKVMGTNACKFVNVVRVQFWLLLLSKWESLNEIEFRDRDIRGMRKKEKKNHMIVNRIKSLYEVSSLVIEWVHIAGSCVFSSHLQLLRWCQRRMGGELD